MTMGLILLGIMALTLFFGFGRRIAQSLGITSVVFFLLLVVMAVGIIVPAITPNASLYINVGGYIIPILLSIALLIKVINRENLASALVAMFAVVITTAVILMFMPTTTTLWAVFCSLEIGIVGGAVAYFITKRPIESVFALTSGVCVGNLVFALVNYFAWGSAVFSLGNPVVYNGLLVAVLFVVCAHQILEMMGKSFDDGTSRRRTRASFEAGKDNRHENDDDYFKDLF